jgi:4-amino-4-deoxy-L-arabinose transferase-like glycosyltransferase
MIEQNAGSVNNASGNIKTTLYLFFIIAFAAILRIICFAGVEGSDNILYNREAYFVSTGDFESRVKDTFRPTTEYITTIRTGLTFPVALFFKLFGVSKYISAIYPLLCSITVVALSFYVGRFFFDTNTGLITALLMSIIPIDVTQASIVLADIPASLFAGLCLFLFFLAETKQNRRVVIALYLLSGISLGITYLTKESAIFPALVLLFYVIYRSISRRKINWDYLFSMGGFLLIFIPETLYYYSKTGYLLIHAYAARDGNNVQIPYTWMAYVNSHQHPYFQRLLIDYGRMLLFSFKIFGLHFWVAGIAMIYLLKNRLKQSYTVIFWFLSLLFLYNFFSTSLSSYKPLFLMPRYFILLNLPASLIIAYFLNRLINNNIRGTKSIRTSLIVLSIAFVIGTLLFYIGKGFFFFVGEKVYNLTGHHNTFSENIGAITAFYYKLLIIGAVLSLGFLLTTYIVLKRNIRVLRFVGCVIICLLTLSSTYWSLTTKFNDTRYYSSNENLIHEFFGDSLSKDIYTDFRTMDIIEYLYKYKYNEKIKSFVKAKYLGEGLNYDYTIVDIKGLKDCYVIMSAGRVGYLNQYLNMPIPPYIENPPPYWVKVAEFGFTSDTLCSIFKVP